MNCRTPKQEQFNLKRFFAYKTPPSNLRRFDVLSNNEIPRTSVRGEFILCISVFPHVRGASWRGAPFAFIMNSDSLIQGPFRFSCGGLLGRESFYELETDCRHIAGGNNILRRAGARRRPGRG
jgi:hypothetical protein